MESRSERKTPSRWIPGLSQAALSFAVGLIGGAVCIPGIHRLVYGDLDPFARGWPLLLEVSAFVLAAIVAGAMRSPIVAAPGLYAGLVARMLASGEAEYPVASMIALAIHGLVPAALGVGLGLWIRFVSRSRLAQSNATNSPLRRSSKAGRM